MHSAIFGNGGTNSHSFSLVTETKKPPEGGCLGNKKPGQCRVLFMFNLHFGINRSKAIARPITNPSIATAPPAQAIVVFRLLMESLSSFKSVFVSCLNDVRLVLISLTFWSVKAVVLSRATSLLVASFNSSSILFCCFCIHCATCFIV